MEGDKTRPQTDSNYADGAIGVIVLGMAGSGKTTVVQRFSAYLREIENSHFIINLDPAVRNPFYKPDLDIRDSVKYKDLMREHGWGPNGAIIACLNLFAAQEETFVPSIQSHRDPGNIILVDTPGQIEVFTISASGEVITGVMSGFMPTVGLYIIDAPRSSDPITFTSNMLYACSVLFRLKIPLVLVINKVDITPPTKILKWISDPMELEDAFDERRKNPDSPECYQAIVSQDISDVLSEFFDLLPTVSFSATTGLGCSELMEAIKNQSVVAKEDHKKDIEELRKGKEEADRRCQRRKLNKFRSDRAGEGIMEFEDGGDDDGEEEELDLELCDGCCEEDNGGESD
eukprot:gnl/Chilomastix_caulleri/1432.p1 GENE.gnl/Chilomastix_caulleri/1432~~gnl/Chilomastix_caulleri/1432.p1  ORF type:complete len:345 (+),score=68.24 gnl/Chilomastix_caulleri/1432:29-1063(+)